MHTKKTDEKKQDGILLLDKPKGITSFTAIQKVKKILNATKVGHAGTLDPLATGLLIVLLGKATKVAKFMEDLDKEYIAMVHFGVTTDSYDAEGNTVLTKEVNINKNDIKSAIINFQGEIEQMPPIYSAIKIKGKPAYEYARKGREVDLKKRLVNIYELTLMNFNLPYAEIKVKCSKGTYIRSLAHDIGQYLQCGAHIKELRRTAVGNFRIEKASGLDNIGKPPEKIININDSLEFIPYIKVKNEHKNKILNGIKPREDFFIKRFLGQPGYYRLVDENNVLLAITRFDKKKDFIFKKVFSGENL